MSKPEWNEDTPKWANWLAQDKDGEYCWWNKKPDRTKSLWTQGSPEADYRFESAGYFPKSIDWEKTLERRP